MSAEEIIRHNGAALADAINARNAEAAAALYTEDGAVLPAGAPRQSGVDAIRDFWKAAIDAGLADVELETHEVTHVDDDAIEVGRLTAKMGATPLEGKYMVHWKRSAGGWLLHRDIWCWDA